MVARTDEAYWDSSWSTTGGCLPVSPGCAHCYGAQLTAQQTVHNVALHTGVADWMAGAERWTHNGNLSALAPEHPAWEWPLRWPGAIDPKLGVDQPSLIFVNVLTDTFQTNRPAWVIDKTVSTIAASQHIGLFLTKYCERLVDHFDRPRPEHWRQRCWVGLSAERQQEFDQRWAVMRRLPDLGYVTFASLAPLLGPIVLPDDFLRRASWVVIGGETGRGWRPMNPDWARSIRDACREAGVPLFVYRMAGRKPIPPDLRIHQFPKATPAAS